MVPQRPTPGNPALPQSVVVTAGSCSASAAPEVAAALRDLLADDVADWQRLGFERIKLRTVRRVFRGRLGDATVHLKVFRADTIAARARDLLRTARGEREVRHLLQARALGLPAVEPLAFGMAREHDQLCSFVVTRTVDAKPFALPAHALPADNRAARAVGALLRRVHDLGIEAGDLHPGNVLVDGDGQPWLCDLTSLRHGGVQDLRRRATALGFFCNPLDGGALDARAKPVRDGYEAAGPPLPDGFAQQLALAAQRWRAAAMRSFGRRSERSCRHTDAEPRRRGRERWFWHLGEPGSCHPAGDPLADGRHSGSSLFGSSLSGSSLSGSNLSGSNLSGSNDGAIDPAAQTTCRSLRGTEPAPVRTGRRGAVWLTADLAVKDRQAGKARALWRAHYWLAFAGVPTPQPLALSLFAGRGRVFCRRIPGTDLATELASSTLQPHELLAAAKALGNAIGRLHGHGLRNRDLKFENLMRNPATGTVVMLDLDGVSLHGADDTRGAGRDLGRLQAAFRHADQPGGALAQRAFLSAYVRARRRLLQRPPLRRLLRRAEERAGEWALRHASRADPAR